MRIILQQEVTSLGKVGDQVTVKAGFGRNYLLPQGMATLASEKNIAEFEARRGELEKASAEVLANAKKRAKKLEDLIVVIKAQAGDEGKLFGSIGPKDIALAVSDKGVPIEKKEVLMPEGAIRQIGEFTLNLKLHSEVIVALKIKIESESSR